MVGAISFLLGAIVNASAQNIPMLIIGRVFLGGGIGFGNQAVPLYLSEMAPAKSRGKVNQLFQLAVCVGILVANLVNYLTDKMHPNGWRMSLGVAGVPALLMLLGAIFFCPETPNSLVEQGKLDEARRVLEKIRGTKNVEAEFEELIDASELAQALKSPYKILLRRKYLPQFVVGAIGIPAFQQLTGCNFILFYAPVIFQSLRFGAKASLLSSFITNGALLVATVKNKASCQREAKQLLLI